MFARTGQIINKTVYKQISINLLAKQQLILKYNEPKINYISTNPLRSFCSQKTIQIPNVDYAQIKDLKNHPEKLLVDVRSADEIKETGLIPTSINIPLDDVANELGSNVNAKLFEAKYGRHKPTECSEVIFSCKSGKRALKAAECTATLGYKNVKYYKGSWIDWAKHEGLPH